MTSKQEGTELLLVCRQLGSDPTALLNGSDNCRDLFGQRCASLSNAPPLAGEPLVLPVRSRVETQALPI